MKTPVSNVTQANKTIKKLKEETNMKTNTMKTVISTLTALFILSSAPTVFSQPDGSNSVVAKKWRVVNGEQYLFEKHIDDAGDVQTVITDAQGNVVKEKSLRPAKKKIIGQKLRKKLRGAGKGKSGATIKVNIALELPEEDTQEVPETGEVDLDGGVVVTLTLDGEELSDNEFKKRQKGKVKARLKRAAGKEKARAAHLHTWAAQNGFKDLDAIQRTIDSTGSTVTVDLTASEIESLERGNDGTIRGIELYEEGEDDIAQAMVDTSISTSALPYSSTRGSGIGIYMTESGCANESRITNYDRLAGSETSHSRNVGAIIRAVSPASRLYCRGGAVLPTTIDLYAAAYNSIFGRNVFPVLNPPIQVINRSNGGNYTTTNYSTVDRDWDNFVYSTNIPAFLSAGNRRTVSGVAYVNVASPAKGLNMITVGNYNDVNDAISSSSSYIDPQTGNDKPEISAPGMNIVAGGFTMSGTSMSSPHAAAFAADMMSSSTYLKYRPHMVKAKMLAGATDTISGGWDKVGLGGIDFASAQWSGSAKWYEGENNSFVTFANADGTIDNYIEKRVYISSYWDAVRVAISWLTRGSYTYDHRNDAHPIGMDLDLRVYDPYGRSVGASYSWDNNFETVEFAPAVSGYYTVKINRFSNRDTANKLRLGLYVNYFND